MHRKMKKLYLIAAALITFASCSNEEEILNDIQQNAYHSIAATIEQGATDSRGAIDANNTFSFFDGEEIQIFVDDPDNPEYQYKFDSATGSFIPVNAVIPAGSTIIGAYYGGTDGTEGDEPYGSASLEGVELCIGLPQNTYFLYNPNHNIMLPLWGELTANGLYFKHLAGILRVNMSNLPEGYDILAVHTSNPMSGSFIVDDITDDEPFMRGTGRGENEEGLMTIRFQPTTASTPYKTLYIPLPKGIYPNIQVLVSKHADLAEGNYQDAITLAYWENKEIERATIYTANLDCNKSKYNLPIVESVFTNGGYFTLTEDVRLDEPLTVPSGKTVKLNLNGFTLTTSTSASTSESYDITNHGTLFIEDGTIQSANGAIFSDGHLKLEDCVVSTENNQTNTIQITGGSFNAEDSKITNTAQNAATNGNDYYVLNIQDADANLSVEVSSDYLGGIQVANSTLSLDDGTYKAGNFYPLNIENATVNFTSSATFTPATGNVIINATAGSTINGETLTNNTSIQCITSLAEMQSAFSTGGIYMQTADIELDTPLALAAGKSLTLNMCNKMLTTTEYVTHAIINEGTLTLKEGIIKTDNTAIWSKSGKLSLEASTLVTNTNRVNVLTATGGTVLVKGGSFYNHAPQADTDASQYTISLKNVSDAQINQGDIQSESLGGICIDNSKLTFNDSNCMVAKFYCLYLVNSSNVTHINTNIMCFKEEYAEIFASAGCTVNGTLYTVDTPLHQ